MTDELRKETERLSRVLATSVRPPQYERDALSHMHALHAELDRLRAELAPFKDAVKSCKDNKDVITWTCHFDDCVLVHWLEYNRMRDAIASPRPAVPEGYAIVPVEPTKEVLIEMAKAARDWLSESGLYPRSKAVYRAMLTAAPTPPADSDDAPTLVRGVNGRCPDDGACHHDCPVGSECWRSRTCLPLTCSGLNDDWSKPADASGDGREAWRPIESAPRDDTEAWLLVPTDEGPICVLGVIRAGTWCGAFWTGHNWASATVSPTHWQPLPEPPAAQAEKGGE